MQHYGWISKVLNYVREASSNVKYMIPFVWHSGKGEAIKTEKKHIGGCQGWSEKRIQLQ